MLGTDHHKIRGSAMFCSPRNILCACSYECMIMAQFSAIVNSNQISSLRFCFRTYDETESVIDIRVGGGGRCV